MDIHTITQEIYKFYPRGIAGTVEAFDHSPEIKHLLSVINEKKNAPIWDSLFQNITALTPLYTRMGDIIPIFPCRSFSIIGNIENGYQVDICIYVSLISPYWSMYTLKSKQLEEAEVTAIFQGYEKEIQHIKDSIERHHFIEKLMKDKLGDDYANKERKWKEYHPTSHPHLEAISSIFSKYGWIKFPPENLHETVLDVATFGHKDLNTSTFFDCLFMDRDQIM